MPPEPAFIMGMMVGALLLWAIQSWRRRGRAAVLAKAREDALVEHNGRLNGELGELRQRLTVLEAIATDPAHRTAAEIELLRG